MKIKYFIIFVSLFIYNLVLGAAIGRSGQRLAPSARRAFMQQKRAFYTAPKIDYYAAFEIPEEDYSERDLAKIYKLLAKSYHPDLAPKELNKQFTERFQEISNTYEQIKANEDLPKQDILQEESPKWQELKRKLEENYAYFVAHKKKQERAPSQTKEKIDQLRDSKFKQDYKPELREEIIQAIKTSNNQALQKIIESNSNDIDMLLDWRENTPLLFAIMHRNLPAVKILLEHGANPNLTNIMKQNPLFFAYVKTNPGLAKLLLKHGANPNKLAHSAPTLNNVVYKAALSGEPELLEILRLLLDFGANLDQKEEFVIRSYAISHAPAPKITAIEFAENYLELNKGPFGEKFPNRRLLKSMLEMLKEEPERRAQAKAIGEPTLSISERIQKTVKNILGEKS